MRRKESFRGVFHQQMRMEQNQVKIIGLGFLRESTEKRLRNWKQIAKKVVTFCRQTKKLLKHRENLTKRRKMEKINSNDRKAPQICEIVKVRMVQLPILSADSQTCWAICLNGAILSKNMTWMRSCCWRTWNSLTMTTRIIATSKRVSSNCTMLGWMREFGAKSL